MSDTTVTATNRRMSGATPAPPAKSRSRAPRTRRNAGGSGKPGDSTGIEWHRRIAEAAYFKAERRGFLPGLELQDWLEAERDIDGMTHRG